MLAMAEPATPKALMQVFGFNGDPASGRSPILLTLLTLHIANVLRLLDASSFTILPPASRHDRAQDTTPHKSFLIHGLQPHLLGRLLTQQIWSFKDITFHIFEFPPTMHPLHRISFSTSPETTPEDILTETRRIWFPLPSLNLFDTLLTPQARAQPTPKPLVQLRTSIVVSKLLHNPNNPTAPAILSVTARNPSPPDSWKCTRALLHSMEYRSRDNQPLRVTPVMTCATCHSATHNAPTCPFPTFPLWYGPRPFCPRAPTVSRALHDLELYERPTEKVEEGLDRCHQTKVLHA